MDEPEYINLELGGSEEQAPDNCELYSKETLLHSPLFKSIFPQFNVAIHKKIRTLRNSSLQDDSDQYIALQEEDSQFGVFSDDEFLLDMDEDDRSPQKPSQGINPRSNSDKLKTIQVIVRNSSLLVNGLQFPFNSSVRSSCMVKGVKSGNIQSEDSLFVSLKSGYLLLIRMFYVPYNFTDGDYAEDFDTKNSCMVYKPFVVQWWDTSGHLLAPTSNSTGFSLSAHASGLSVVSSSSSNGFRIYNCSYSEAGMLFQPHFTVPLNGTILHSCFAQPIKGSILDNHVIFLTMVFTATSRLELNLYGWTTSEPVFESLTKSTLPLNSSFPLPVFIISLINNGSFLFVAPDELIIVTVHDITSAEYNFRRHKLDIGFPTNYYCPETCISSDYDENTDEILISAENGTIYSIMIGNSSVISVKPIIRISDPISLFALEEVDNGYELTYGSSSGLNRKLFIDELLPDPSEKPIPYSLSLLMKNYKNWAPMLDVQIIDSFKSKSTYQNSKKELWCITGSGKRSRLSQLRNGYLMSRGSEPYQSLRKVESMMWLKIHGNDYILCSLPFESMLLEYQPDKGEEDLIHVDEAAIIYDAPTVAIKMISEYVAVQITPKSLMVTTFESIIASKVFEDDVILFGDILGNMVLLITQESSSELCTIKLITISDEITGAGVSINSAMDIDETEPLQLLASKQVDYQISFARFLSRNGVTYLVIGSFDGSFQILTFNEDNTITNLQETVLKDHYEEEDHSIDPHFFVPNDFVTTNDTLLLGTKDGYIFHFKFNENSTLEFDKYFKVSDTDVTLHSHSSANSELVFVTCKSMWLINFHGPGVPEPILLEEKNDKPIKSILPVQNSTDDTGMEISILLVRDEGLSLASVTKFKTPSVRQITVGESAKKFIYLPHTTVFAVLSNSKDPTARLRYVDRKTYKLMPHTEFNNKNKKYDSGSSIFDADEYPMCASIWSLDSLGRSKKLLVGCSNSSNTGSIKILDISKVTLKDYKPTVKVTNLHSFSHKEPITSIEQVQGTILFSSGKSIYSTEYHTEEKRLRPVANILTVPSEITSITITDSQFVSISTKLDSVYQFEYKVDSYSNKGNLQLVASDLSSKLITNHAVLNPKIVIADKVHSNITIMTREATNLIASARFKTVGVPRVFKANFDSFWLGDMSSNTNALKNSDGGILTVSVDGEVLLFKPVNSDTLEYNELKKHLPMKPNLAGEMEFSTDRWDVTFSGKVTGKGLKAINKPYFRNEANKVGLIDYDLNEVSSKCYSYNSL